MLAPGGHVSGTHATVSDSIGRQGVIHLRTSRIGRANQGELNVGMSRKDFQALADALRMSTHGAPHAPDASVSYGDVVRAVGMVVFLSNVRADMSRFYEACGLVDRRVDQLKTCQPECDCACHWCEVDDACDECNLHDVHDEEDMGDDAPPASADECECECHEAIGASPCVNCTHGVGAET